jgi:acyl carrier protein
MLSNPSKADIATVVYARIRTILEDKGEPVAGIDGADKLNATLGLTSLDLAVLVVELEEALGVDPFTSLVSVTAIRSVDDLIGAYRLAFDPASAVPHDDGLAEAVLRARARRTRLSSGDG